MATTTLTFPNHKYLSQSPASHLGIKSPACTKTAGREAFAKKFGDARFSYDSYRRFIQMYATTAMGLSKEPMEEMLHDIKKRRGIKEDKDIPAKALKKLQNGQRGRALRSYLDRG